MPSSLLFLDLFVLRYHSSFWAIVGGHKSNLWFSVKIFHLEKIWQVIFLHFWTAVRFFAYPGVQFFECWEGWYDVDVFTLFRVSIPKTESSGTPNTNQLPRTLKPSDMKSSNHSKLLKKVLLKGKFKNNKIFRISHPFGPS